MTTILRLQNWVSRRISLNSEIEKKRADWHGWLQEWSMRCSAMNIWGEVYAKVQKANKEILQQVERALEDIEHTWRMYVSLLFLKGTCAAFRARALMQSPRAERDLLINCASFKLSPTAPDLAILSLPARSHSHSLDLHFSSAIMHNHGTEMHYVTGDRNVMQCYAAWACNASLHFWITDLLLLVHTQETSHEVQADVFEIAIVCECDCEASSKGIAWVMNRQVTGRKPDSDRLGGT